MTDFKPIVSMLEYNGRLMVATSDGIYNMVNGVAVLVAGPEHFRLADELWEADKAARERQSEIDNKRTT